MVLEADVRTYDPEITLEELQAEISVSEGQEAEVKKFLPGQRLFMESLARELLYSGAFGAGKSRVGNEKGLYLTLTYPNNYGMICRKRFNDLRYSTLENFFSEVLPWDYNPVLNPVGAAKIGMRWDKTQKELTFPNASRIVFRGLDVPGKIASMNIAWAFVDEAFELTEDDWRMLLSRTRLNRVPFRQLFAATNPASQTHHLYRRFYLDNHPRREVIESNTLENTYLPPDYLEVVDDFKGIYRQRYVEGKWVSFEGQVYSVWDPRVHIVQKFDIPIDWPRYRAIDFGFTNPFVCQWWAVDPESGPDFDSRVKYCYREIYMSQREVEEHARDILAVENQEGKGLRYQTFGDWDAEGRATLARYGIPVAAAKKDVSEGIQEVHHQMSKNLLRFFPRDDILVEEDYILVNGETTKPSSTLEEIGGYEWRKLRITDATGNEKEEPKKQNDHGMDAMRMFIYTMSSASSTKAIGGDKKSYFGKSWNEGPRIRFGQQSDPGSQGRNWSSMR